MKKEFMSGSLTQFLVAVFVFFSWNMVVAQFTTSDLVQALVAFGVYLVFDSIRSQRARHWILVMGLVTVAIVAVSGFLTVGLFTYTLSGYYHTSVYLGMGLVTAIYIAASLRK